jgi:DNA-binding transcriptional LysR family regulator
VITAPELFGRLKVLPVLESFLRQEPLIAARFLLVNRIVDLLGEGVDLAIRLAHLPDSTMTGIKLGEVRTLVCGSPDYLARAGSPGSPRDLDVHECIGLNAEGDGELWPFASPNEKGGRVRSVRVPTRLSLNHAGAAIDAALRGQGLIRARSYQVADDIASGRLLTVLEAFEPPPVPAHIVFHPDRGRSGPVRAFVDHAVPALRAELRRIASKLGPGASKDI